MSLKEPKKPKPEPLGVEKKPENPEQTKEQIMQLEKNLYTSFMKDLKGLLDKYEMDIQITFQRRSGPRG